MPKQIYNMELHHKIIIDDGTEVRRVPGGWIYTRFQLYQVLMPDGQWCENYLPTSVFVPFNDEFKD
ncbi:unnamed protein product [marine sediment metagenome]|uniref:Uncharacterized protein n=1 Tax=marine sediment metagenome TaxID=412755 RepID=X1DAF7_9ZZZZ